MSICTRILTFIDAELANAYVPTCLLGLDLTNHTKTGQTRSRTFARRVSEKLTSNTQKKKRRGPQPFMQCLEIEQVTAHS